MTHGVTHTSARPSHDYVVPHAREGFWFVSCISNPLRYRSRVRLYEEFRTHVLNDVGANLLTVELCQGAVAPVATAPDGLLHSASDCDDGELDRGLPGHRWSHGPAIVLGSESAREIRVQVRGDSVLWHKENLLNIGIRALPRSCKYVAWVDADVAFLNASNIVRETVDALQTHRVVQMFRNCVDLGPKHEALQLHTSFAHQFESGEEYPSPSSAVAQPDNGKTPSRKKGVVGCHSSGPHWHPGYAWAARRETLNALGGLFERAILGSGDHTMALCMIGRGKDSIPAAMHPNYARLVEAYQRLCDVHVGRKLGHVPGTILHNYHGSKESRAYISRWDILKKNRYDPLVDVKHNLHGVLEFASEKPEMHAAIRRYFEQRNEDAT